MARSDPTRAQAGCLDYVWCADPSSESRVYVYERWSDTPSFAAHLAGPCYRDMLAVLGSHGLRRASVAKYRIDRSEPASLAHPRWLLKALRAHWPQQASQIIAANNEAPPMTLRVNTARVTREDMLARVGGEEFAVLVPEVAMEGARILAEKIRALVEKSVFKFEDQPIPVTASFGVACLEPNVRLTAAELFQAGDERLYAAKKAGRNRVM